ncbi:hypothetical protein WL98_06165 [Burkholderia multivorans]|nr:hypothetical protein WL98_06165 [Burkholderia multivorans]
MSETIERVEQPLDQRWRGDCIVVEQQDPVGTEVQRPLRAGSKAAGAPHVLLKSEHVHTVNSLEHFDRFLIARVINHDQRIKGMRLCAQCVDCIHQ